MASAVCNFRLVLVKGLFFVALQAINVCGSMSLKSKVVLFAVGLAVVKQGVTVFSLFDDYKNNC